MRVELPSGNWVDIRDKLMAADKLAVQDAVTFTMSTANDTQKISAGVTTQMRIAFFAQTITAWSFEGIPIPSTGLASPESVIGQTLDLDDYNALEDATQEMFDKIRNSGGKNPN
jgi:hypothetical protein